MKRRVVTAHVKDLEKRLSELVVLVAHPPPMLAQVEKDLAVALAAVRNALSLLTPVEAKTK